MARRSLLSLRDRLVLLAFVVPVAAAAATCASCVAPRIAGVRTPVETPRMQEEGSVDINVTCPDGKKYAGSGVVVGRQEVVTAAHVVTCEEGKPPTLVQVDATGNGTWLVATPDAVLPTRDIARVHVLGDLGEWYHPFTLAPEPEIGDELCEAAVEPRWDYRCGKVESVSDTSIRVSMVIEPGNSGAAVYDVEGRLVGFTVSGYTCQGDVYCTGNIARASGLDWLQE
jgi:S1-C subfamily serine protease